MAAARPSLGVTQGGENRIMARMSRVLYGTALSALLLGAGVAAAQTVELGEAPRRFESQDTSGWVYPVVPKSAKTRAEVAALSTPYTSPATRFR
jgi:hypothetical protein